MRWWLRAVCVLTVAALAYVGSPPCLLAEGIENLKNGVVKITAHVDGKTKTGTGFIVRLEKETAYIITASHVVEGDPQPKVVFRPDDTKVFPAHLKGLEGDDRRGLAALVVQGRLPDRLETIPLNQDFHVTGGEEGIVIGFPLVPAVPWAVTSSVMTGQHGKYLVFSGAAVEGNSGGPIMVTGKVVGVVTEVSGQYGYAVPIPIVRLALRGWGVPLGAVAIGGEAAKPHVGKDPASAGAPVASIDYSNFDQVKKAAERGDSRAMFQLGEMHSDGKVVQENFVEAAKWYRRSADAGYPDAHTSMGVISLIKAVGLADSDESAVRFGSDESKKSEFISMIIHTERLQIRNQMALKESVKWLRMGAEQGHDANAQFVLGLLTGAGVGVEKDPVQGAKWIRLAATKEPAAQAFMGIYYLTGRGVEKDFVEAARRLREAAGKEVPIAYAPLGMMYAEGLGVVKDYTEAGKWLRKGVQQGDPEAKGYLGMLYLLGWGGPQDLTQAYRLAKEAAEQGDQTGQFVLGVMFFSGNGVPQNGEESLKWLQAAARQGYSPAEEFLRERGQNW